MPHEVVTLWLTIKFAAVVLKARLFKPAKKLDRSTMYPMW
jgi:hypothetical protein